MYAAAAISTSIPVSYTHLTILGMVLGMAATYIFGTLWLAAQMELSFTAALSVGVDVYKRQSVKFSRIIYTDNFCLYKRNSQYPQPLDHLRCV